MPKVKFNHSNKLNSVLMMIICGATNSGKTHLLFRMLTTPNILDFNNLLIFTNTPEQSYYQFLKHGFNNNLSKTDIQALHKLFEEDDNVEIGQIPDMCQKFADQVDTSGNSSVSVTLTNEKNKINDPSELPKSKKNLVVFDDCVNDKDQTLQKTFFTRGRHNNCCCIYLTQSFYGLNGQDIRKNANVFVLFGMTQRSVSSLLQDVDAGSRETFKRLSERQWNDPSEHKYIAINIHKPKTERIFTDIFT